MSSAKGSNGRPSNFRMRRMFQPFGERIPSHELFSRSIANAWINSHVIMKNGKAVRVEWRPTALGQLAELRNRGSAKAWGELKSIEKRDWRLRVDRIFQQFRAENNSRLHDQVLLFREWELVEKELDRVDRLLGEKIPFARRMGLIQLRKRLIAYSSILIGINGSPFQRP